jgi:hypothetical protein
MFVKALFGGGTLIGLGLYLHSAVGWSYSRDVGATPAEVRSALEDLDIREAPGEPATDPSRSGGVAPVFQLTESGNDMVWTVTSGDEVAVKMIAHLVPTDGGKHTRVTAEVERGDAPDDYVAPAFRSPGVTRGLFAMVLDQELDEMFVTQSRDSETCQKIMDDFEAASPDFQEQRGFGAVAKVGLRLSALESKLKAAGCPTGFSGKFEPVSNQLGSGSEPPMTMTEEQHRDGVNFEPGKPMIDPSKDSPSY